MIEGFSLKTAHLYGDALASQARLRYRVFVQQRGLDHSFYDEMEYDEFDTPATVYLVWRDTRRVVRGLIRLIPTSLPYMAEKYWPTLFQTRELPKSSDVWETSRLCVDRSLDPAQRRTILPELLCGLEEFCEANFIRAVVGVTYCALLNEYVPGGLEWLCNPTQVEGRMESAFWEPVPNVRVQENRVKYGLNRRVLSLIPSLERIAA
jgi:acyl homoserine lactone synthase